MNQVGEVFEMEKAVCREMDIQQLHQYIAESGLTRAGTWGFRKPTRWKNLYYEFRVNGHHHKGLVGIVLDGSDTFTIYYFGVINKKIKKVREMVYIDELLDVLDKDIERIEEYVR